MSSGKKRSAVAESFFTAKDNGTVPRQHKQLLAQYFGGMAGNPGFGMSIMDNVLATEMYLNTKEEEPKKWECRTVCETTVTPGTLINLLHSNIVPDLLLVAKKWETIRTRCMEDASHSFWISEAI